MGASSAIWRTHVLCAICLRKPFFIRRRVWASCLHIPQIFTERLPRQHCGTSTDTSAEKR